MNSSRIRALVKKELNSYFDSPSAYVLFIVWLVAASYFFFRAAFLNNEASLRPLFELLPWLLLFFVPAATMRSLAAEKKDGTLEVLLSHPISEAEVIIGKLVANVVFILIALALTLPIPVGLAFGGRLDIGMVVGEYLGAAFLIVGLASVGLFASSLSRNQTVAFIISLAITFLLVASGMEYVLMAIPFPLTAVVRQMSALSHFNSMTRGVIFLGDTVYFAALTLAFATLSYFGLKQERESHRSSRYKNLRLGTGLMIIVAVLSSLIGTAAGGRVDLTSGKLYSLSGTTVKTLRGLPDKVTIKFYASRQLPTEVESSFRDIKDIISDYQAASNGRVDAIFKSPEDGAQAQQEIQEAGIRQVQFNVVGQDGYQVKQGYLGLTIDYQNQREAIPFISKTDDLEYQLTRLINKMSRTKRKKVAFLTVTDTNRHAQASDEQGGYDAWRQMLGDEYEVTDLKLGSGRKVPANIGTVIIAGPRGSVPPEELFALEAFLKRGGSILALIDGLDVNPKMMYVVPNRNNFDAFIEHFGFKVEPKLLFDTRANQPINAGSPGNTFSLPYPFWMRVGPASDDLVVRDVGSVVIPWGQPVGPAKPGQKVIPLLATTQFAGAQTKDFAIAPDPNMKVDQGQLSQFLVAGARKFKGGGRMIVVGDSDFLRDRFIAVPESQNGAFGVNAVDWLIQDSSLTEIRAKNTQARMLVFPSETTRNMVRYINLIGLPLAVAAGGAIRLNRRRRLTRRKYAA